PWIQGVSSLLGSADLAGVPFAGTSRVDGGLAQHTAALVDHHGLPRGDTAHAFWQVDHQFIVALCRAFHMGYCRHRIAVGAHLHHAIELFSGEDLGNGHTGPGNADAAQLVYSQQCFGADNDLVLLGTDLQDETRLAIGRRTAQAQALALAYGEGLGAFMLAELIAFVVDNFTWLHFNAFGQPATGIEIG